MVSWYQPLLQSSPPSTWWMALLYPVLPGHARLIEERKTKILFGSYNYTEAFYSEIFFQWFQKKLAFSSLCTMEGLVKNRFISPQLNGQCHEIFDFRYFS
jgi:hypothetical protein